MSSENPSSNGVASKVTADGPMVDVTDPRDTDVLCGRGGAALRHPGNQTYRRLVNLNKGLYITCLKTEKLKISRSIVAAIREQNGRFLEKDNVKETWYDIGDKKAIEKTSQALREGQPKLRQKIVEMGGGAAGTAALMEHQYGVNGLYTGSAGQRPASAMQQQQQPFDPTNLTQQLGAAAAGMGITQSMGGMGGIISGHHRPQRPHQQMSNDMPPPQTRQALHTELMRLSMHGDETEPQQRMANISETMPLRPSLVKRNSQCSAMQGGSNMSLMSDFSGIGNSNHGQSQFGSMFGNLDTSLSNSRHRYEKGIGGGSSHMHSYFEGGGAAAGLGLGSSNHGMAAYHEQMDRRRIFARMKYRHPSDRLSSRGLGGASQHSTGDGMPDFHMVESQMSLYSNLSGMAGNELTGGASSGDGDLKPAAQPPRDLLGGAGSRHSIMSGLSRISDNDEVHSIFSDLSRKIGNVSTRSIAMSEISGIDEYRGGHDDESDSTPSFGEADPRSSAAGVMDFDAL